MVAMVTTTPNRGRCTGRRRPTEAAGTCTADPRHRPRTITTGPPALTRCPGPSSNRPITMDIIRTGPQTGRPIIISNRPPPATSCNPISTSCRRSANIPAKWLGCTWTITPTPGSDPRKPLASRIFDFNSTFFFFL